MRKERRNTTTDFAEVKRIISEYYEQLYANKVDKLIKWTIS